MPTFKAGKQQATIYKKKRKGNESTYLVSAAKIILERAMSG